jgi:hypothetical protein
VPLRTRTHTSGPIAFSTLILCRPLYKPLSWPKST